MGLLNMLKHKKSSGKGKGPTSSKARGRRGKNNDIPLATADLTKKERKTLGKVMKQVNKEVPILHYLKPKPISLSYLADHLKEYAQNKDGAVRILTDDHGEQAYTVLVITEQMFEDMGFSVNKKENPEGVLDLGQIAAQMASYQIATATTVLDYEQKRLVIIPTQETLDALAEYDEFKGTNFQWGAFPIDDVMLDVHKAVSMVLPNGVSLEELQNIAANHLDLQLNENSEVAIVEDDDSSADTSDDDQTDGGFDPTDELNDDSSYDDMSDDDTDDDFQNPAFDGQNSQSTAPTNNQSQQPVSQPAPQQPAMNTTQQMLNGAGDDTNSQQGPMNSQQFSDLMTQAGITDSSNASSSADSVDLSAIPDDDDTVTNNNTSADSVPPMQSPNEYAANLAEAEGSIQTFSETIDQELQLSVDYSVFDHQSERRKPIQFTIEPAAKNDRLGQLANQYRQNYNAELAAATQAQENALREAFASRARAAASYISQRMNALKGNNSKLAQKQEEIEARYKDNLQAFDSAWEKRVIDEERKYNDRKEQAANAARERALTEFDQTNRQAFENNLKNERIREENAKKSDYMRERSELLNQKVKIGQAAYNATLVKIMKDVNKVREANYEENKRLFQKFDRSIHNILNSNYETEQNRQIAAAKLLDHDKRVEEAQAKAVQMEKEYKIKLKQVQEDADERISKISKIANDNVRQAKETYEGRIDQLKDQLAQSQKNAQLADEKHQHELDQVKSDSQAEINRIISEHDRSDKMTDSQADRSRKTMIFITIISVIAALLVGAMAGMALKKSPQPAQQPQVQQQQPTSSKSDDSDSKSPTKVYNYYGGSQGQKSSDEGGNSEKSSASTHASSHANSSDAE